MEENIQPQSPTPEKKPHFLNKKVLIIGVAIFFVAIGITVGILAFFKSRNTSETITTETPKTAILQSTRNIDQIVDEYVAIAQPFVDDALYKKRGDSATVGSFAYQKDSSYSVSVNATHSIQYDVTGADIANNDALIGVTVGFLTGSGLTQTSTTTLTDGSVISLYDSSDVACQLYSGVKTEFQAGYVSIACATHLHIDEIYKEINDLLTLYGSPVESTYTVEKTIAITEGKKSLQSILLLPSDETKTSSTLIFATAGDVWEYIGQRPTPSPDEKDSFVLPESLQSTIESKTEYESFLKDSIN